MNDLLLIGLAFIGAFLVLALMLILWNLSRSVIRLERATNRIEAAALVVKNDLHDSQQRADQVPADAAAGEAADAGAQSEKPNNKEHT